jgi:hypothetical protein
MSTPQWAHLEYIQSPPDDINYYNCGCCNRLCTEGTVSREGAWDLDLCDDCHRARSTCPCDVCEDVEVDHEYPRKIGERVICAKCSSTEELKTP